MMMMMMMMALMEFDDVIDGDEPLTG